MEHYDYMDRLASRHIARLLSRLGNTIEPIIRNEIKKEIRFLIEDIRIAESEGNNE